MPELPAVETIKRYIDANALHKKIDHVEIKDRRILSVSAQTLKTKMKSKSFTDTKRTGKYLFIHAGRNNWMALHFGMTGSLVYNDGNENIPDYSCVIFHFTKDKHLYYTSRRKLGSINITEDPDHFCREHDIGADALEVNKKKFIELMRSKHGKVKTVLMDQKVISGIGNVYSDEILYQCHIHPETQIDHLNEKQLNDLYSKMKSILKTSIKHHANAGQLPDSYLTSHRKEGEDCPKCKGRIKRIKVSGRGCYICPSCQKLKNAT